ncbi:hypothetical protein ma852 [Moumouvirus australiensis]|uniref:Uncharacterized protein n=1 Tax=Moumouvirus australiensis TaxID=2109587 RepID=A0A2P1EMZ1_9VIRU|nr:hypothetical protein QKC55_gp052 [Moumouvirus australiensis]AVL95239.1 hypothetical protein ma852 [Moumouvirus australiensis]
MSDKPINLHLPGINAPSNLQATFLAHGTAGGLTAYSASASYHKDLNSGAFFGGSGSYSGMSGYGRSTGGGHLEGYVGYNFLARK